MGGSKAIEMISLVEKCVQLWWTMVQDSQLKLEDHTK